MALRFDGTASSGRAGRVGRRKPALSLSRRHKEVQLLRGEQLLLRPQRRRIAADDRHVMHHANEGRVVREALAPGFVRLEIGKGHPAQGDLLSLALPPALKGLIELLNAPQNIGLILLEHDGLDSVQRRKGGDQFPP